MFMAFKLSVWCIGRALSSVYNERGTINVGLRYRATLDNLIQPTPRV